MLKWIETTGRSEEDAISAALFQLGLDRDDVSIEVIERAKSGFLGFGGNPAKVRVSYEEENGKPVPKKDLLEEEAVPASAPIQERQEEPPLPRRRRPSCPPPLLSRRRPSPPRRWRRRPSWLPSRACPRPGPSGSAGSPAAPGRRSGSRRGTRC